VALCRTSEDKVGEAMILVTDDQLYPTSRPSKVYGLFLPSRCRAVKPPSSVDIFSIAFGSAMDAIRQSHNPQFYLSLVWLMRTDLGDSPGILD
jgi:hypothetical protein